MGKGTAYRHGFADVIGQYWVANEESARASWVGNVASVFTSDQPQEVYPWLGQNPAMRKWDGERSFEELRGDSVTLINDDYEATLWVKRKDLRRDQTGQLRARIGELADRAAQLPQKLISTLISANGTAYDGVAFFADTHSVGVGGTIDNLMTAADGGLAGGSTPTTAQMSANLIAMVGRMMSFKDDKGEPMNEAANGFSIMVTPNLLGSTLGAVKDTFVSGGASNTLASTGWSFAVYSNARLTSTNVIYLFRTDGRVRPFIYQEEMNELEALGEQSEHAFKTNTVAFGAHVSGAAGYGRFEYAIKGTLA